MSNITVDRGRFPFVYVRFGRDPATDAEVMGFIGELRRVQQMRERYVLFVDAGRLQSTVAKHRKMYADWIKESDGKYGNDCLAVVLIVTSPLVRGAIQAILWLVTSDIPIHTFGTSREGAIYAADLMKREGLVDADAPLAVVEANSESHASR